MSRDMLIDLKRKLDTDLSRIMNTKLPRAGQGNEAVMVETHCAAQGFCEEIYNLFGVKIRPSVRYDMETERPDVEFVGVGDVDSLAWNELRRVVAL